MPLTIPRLDDRQYQDLLDEALARVPIHNREWTNFNESDPGVTIVELFAFLTENLLYRSNQIPERNRRKFLLLLGVPLKPASSARGIVAFTNERGPLQVLTLNDGLEVRAGQVPFRTELGLDVLPIESRMYYKRVLANPSDKLKKYYEQLYESFRGQPPVKEVTLYETVAFESDGTTGIDLGKDTVDGSLWIALLVREADKQIDDDSHKIVREAIGGKTMNIGIMPSLSVDAKQLKPGGKPPVADTALLEFKIPSIPASGGLPTDLFKRIPQYRPLEARSTVDVLTEPGIVQVTLPSASELTLWNNIDPLESGAGDFPPALEDSTLEKRLITWIRIQANASADAKLLWAGINAICVNQRNHVANESLPPGTGQPDQSATLSRTPVIPGSVSLTMVTAEGVSEKWEEIDDLLCAGSEVPVEDMRQSPGRQQTPGKPTKVFIVDRESGVIQFGDGIRGARPPYNAVIRVDYDYGVGRAGNVGPRSINAAQSLPAGLKVANLLPTWGGAEAETVSEGEKQITRYLQHRDRLVSLDDFATITRRTPGADIGRVEVIPAYNPQLRQNEPGDAPGAVTVMVIPKYDARQPDAPIPDRLFLDAVCNYLEPRRLVTTEVFIRGPKYKPIWISIGINVVAGASVAQVRESVKKALLRYLSPLPQKEDASSTSQSQTQTIRSSGWPLRKSVVDIELLAEANRVDGVLSVNNVLLAEGAGAAVSEIKVAGLELPQVAGLSVTTGDAADLDRFRGLVAAVSTGAAAGTTETAAPGFVSVPIIPKGCI